MATKDKNRDPLPAPQRDQAREDRTGEAPSKPATPADRKEAERK